MSDEKDDKWEMPKPVFRSSEGALPRSLEETISHSFMPNAETIEIDEDDDILSILDTPYKPDPPKVAGFAAGLKTIEMDHEMILETEPRSNPEADHKPIVVKAKKPAVKANAASNKSKSGLFILILILVILGVVVAAVLFKFSQSTVPQ